MASNIAPSAHEVRFVEQNTSSENTSMHHISRTVDALFFYTLIGSGLLALLIGYHYGTLHLALFIAPALMVVGGLAFSMRGSTATCLILASCNAAMVMLHIQLGRGTEEFHFGVFVLLALMLAYRDWRPVLFTAGLFAVHHVLFDRLQAIGVGVYCTPEADFLKVVLHAVYVVVQTGVELVIAQYMRTSTLQGAELAAIVNVLNHDKHIALNVEGVNVKTPGGKALKMRY